MTNPLGGGPIRIVPLYQHTEPCGCTMEGIEGKSGVYWVPLTACGEHCPCVACRRTRAATKH